MYARKKPRGGLLVIFLVLIMTFVLGGVFYYRFYNNRAKRRDLDMFCLDLVRLAEDASNRDTSETEAVFEISSDNMEEQIEQIKRTGKTLTPKILIRARMREKKTPVQRALLLEMVASLWPAASSLEVANIEYATIGGKESHHLQESILRRKEDRKALEKLRTIKFLNVDKKVVEDVFRVFDLKSLKTIKLFKTTITDLKFLDFIQYQEVDDLSVVHATSLADLNCALMKLSHRPNYLYLVGITSPLSFVPARLSELMSHVKNTLCVDWHIFYRAYRDQEGFPVQSMALILTGITISDINTCEKGRPECAPHDLPWRISSSLVELHITAKSTYNITISRWLARYFPTAPCLTYKAY